MANPLRHPKSSRDLPGLRLATDPVSDAVAAFGRTVANKLGRGGNPEDQLRAPLEELFRELGRHVGLEAVAYGEVRLKDLRARPDYAVDVGGVGAGGSRVGYVELKAPGRGVPPHWKPDKRERAQWEKLCALPNVLYTDGIRWGRYRYGELASPVVTLGGSLTNVRRPLRPIDHRFEALIHDFLLWEPATPRSLAELIRIVAGLCRLLRDEVAAILSGSPRHAAYEDLTLLAADWRELLFPDLDDQGFSDAYAQTIAFAMLLARVDGISFQDAPLHEIARLLGKKHSLMGRAFAVLTDSEAAEELRTIETLRRVIGAVDWAALDDGHTDVYAELYERFLAVYDRALRKQSGSYYTPQPVAGFMVDFVDEILHDRFKQPWGIAADGVVVVDPAMGTGTFLVEVLRAVADTIDAKQGRGARPARLREFFQERLVGFEIQAAPYAVAELRLHEALKTRFDTEIPRTEVRFLTDALENPVAQEQRLRAPYRVIGRSREEANRIKREVPVMVVIGNPPHVENTKGKAPWIEHRRKSVLQPPPVWSRPSLDEFRSPGRGRYESDLYGLPWCFWRWALWKAFEAHEKNPSGVVAFLTPSSFIKGKSFAGMREYLRRLCDEGWIIDLSPEGNRPPQETRIFGAEVGRQLCIAVFARYGSGDFGRPATVHTLTVNGTRAEKIARLRQLKLSDLTWVRCGDGWQSPFLPGDTGRWQKLPALTDLLPWSSRGVTAGRTWVYAPNVETLRRRWEMFLHAGTEQRRRLFVESRDRRLDSRVPPLPGFPPIDGTLADETGSPVSPLPVAYRSFDRQWLIPDNRLMVMPRPPLWAVRSEEQVYVTEQSNHPIESGPGLTFSDLIPDIHHYNSRSGRVFPLYRDTSAQSPNLSPGLLQLLRRRLASQITPRDFLAYVAGVVAHNGYTRRFQSELQNPGIRIPLTSDPTLWREAVKIGREVLWLHTFGQRYVDGEAGRPRGVGQLVDKYGPRVLAPIPDIPNDMPEMIDHDPTSDILYVGLGQIGPVPRPVYEYDVGGMRVVRHWFDYRSRNPRHKRRSSPLDDENCLVWTPSMTNELLSLLTILDRCIALEPSQEEVLARICERQLITAADLGYAGILPVPQHVSRPPTVEDRRLPPLF